MPEPPTVDELRTAVLAARQHGDDRAIGISEVRLVWKLIDVEAFAEALNYADDAVQRLQRVQGERPYCCALLNAAQVHRGTGDITAAIEYYRRALATELRYEHGIACATFTTPWAASSGRLAGVGGGAE